jgi:hypothetical protein
MKENPMVIKKANYLLDKLSSFTSLERDYQFVECATFADEIKLKGFDYQSHFHYDDQPIKDEGFTDYIPPVPQNVTWAIVNIYWNINCGII